MTVHFTAIVENGVLRPTQPIALPEGARVEVTVESAPPEPEARAAAEILSAIAALPIEGGGDPHTGRDHDKYLYPPANSP